MRAWRRAMNVDGVEDVGVLNRVGLTVAQAEQMYRYLAIANYEDRFVIPSAHREYANDAFGERGGCGFTFGNGCSDGAEETSDASLPKSSPARIRPRMAIALTLASSSCATLIPAWPPCDVVGISTRISRSVTFACVANSCWCEV